MRLHDRPLAAGIISILSGASIILCFYLFNPGFQLGSFFALIYLLFLPIVLKLSHLIIILFPPLVFVWGAVIMASAAGIFIFPRFSTPLGFLIVVLSVVFFLASFCLLTVVPMVSGLLGILGGALAVAWQPKMPESVA